MEHSAHSHPTYFPLWSVYRGPLLRLDANADAEAKEKAEAEAKAKEEAEAKEKEDAEKKKNDTEGRISQLAKEKKELEKKLKEYEDGQKKSAEEKLKEDGKLKELLESKEKELADISSSSKSQAEKLAAYEEIAKEQVKAALESIEDKERRKDAESLLEGRDVSEQFKLIPKILKLAGVEQKKDFGNSTPSSTKTPGKTEVDQKKARFQELYNKKEELTPQERAEKHRLQTELSVIWNKEKEEEKRKTSA